MTYVWSCSCGHEAECEREDLHYGAVYQCSGCGSVWGCVRPRHGGKAWVRIGADDVRFHRLLDEPEYS